MKGNIIFKLIRRSDYVSLDNGSYALLYKWFHRIYGDGRVSHDGRQEVQTWGQLIVEESKKNCMKRRRHTIVIAGQLAPCTTLVAFCLRLP